MKQLEFQSFRPALRLGRRHIKVLLQNDKGTACQCTTNVTVPTVDQLMRSIHTSKHHHHDSSTYQPLSHVTSSSTLMRLNVKLRNL